MRTQQFDLGRLARPTWVGLKQSTVIYGPPCFLDLASPLSPFLGATPDNVNAFQAHLKAPLRIIDGWALYFEVGPSTLPPPFKIFVSAPELCLFGCCNRGNVYVSRY